MGGGGGGGVGGGGGGGAGGGGGGGVGGGGGGGGVFFFFFFFIFKLKKKKYFKDFNKDLKCTPVSVYRTFDYTGSRQNTEVRQCRSWMDLQTKICYTLYSFNSVAMTFLLLDNFIDRKLRVLYNIIIDTYWRLLNLKKLFLHVYFSYGASERRSLWPG
uniref:Uncharacterized protein n=1 Tax=Cacopsylla melanoneura TaxID=428564 RepID=A0A8D8VDH5_9HEMI